MSGQILNTTPKAAWCQRDALTYAERFAPGRSTSPLWTGACIVALGSHTSGLGNTTN